MGKQYNKIEKRRRRAAYLSRRKEKAKQPIAKSAVTKKAVKAAEPVAAVAPDAAAAAPAPKRTRKPKAVKEAAAE